MGLFATVLPAYRRDLVAARARLAEPAVPVDRLTLPWGDVEYARYGDGPTTLVLHGSGGGWDQSVDWAQRRLGPDRCVLAPSRFGYLGSTLPDGATTVTQADAYAALLDALEVERADVVGLSAGAISATRFAGRHPDRVRSLLLESPVLPVRKRPPLPPPAVVRLMTHAEPLLWMLTRTPLFVRLGAGLPRGALDEEKRAELAAITSTTFPLAPRGPGMVFDQAVAGPEMWGDLVPPEAVAAPTLVVNAADAVLAPHDDAAAWVARLPEGRLLDVTSGGHVLIGNVEPLRGVVADFLRDPEGAVAAR